MARKNYKPPKKWVKFRHKAIYKLLRGVMAGYFRLKYGLKSTNDQKKVPSPCIIMCNHQAVMDPFFLSTAFRRPIYFVMSEDLFTLGFTSKLIRWLVEPIPKSKSKSDINTIRYTLKVLKEGGTVGLFPSGNRTLSGREWKIDVGAAKLVKMAKVPLALFNLKGGYGADPRWGGSVRKGKVYASTVKVLSAEEIKEMSVEELHQEIVNTLDVDDTTIGVKFKSKKSAEYLERALYYCPNCRSFNTLKSKGRHLYCTNCELKAEYTEELTFKPISGNVPFDTVREWYDEQAEKLKEKVALDGGELFSDSVEVRLIENFKRKKLGEGKIIGHNTGVDVCTVKGKAFDVKFSDIVGCTILGKRKINFYLDDSLTLQIKGSERFNGIKYLYLYQFYKEGQDNE